MMEQLRPYLNSTYLKIGAALLLFVAFMFLPWLGIGQLTALQLALNYVSSPGDGLLLWLIPLAAVGLIASIRWFELRWAILLSIVSLVWYVYHVATSAFGSNLFGMIGIGFWAAAVATLIGMGAALSAPQAKVITP